jgi:membrane protein implicated in regulation of membrane protease activity
VNIDLRFSLGLLFIAFGVLLTLFGLFTDRATYERSTFINVNLWWGVVMLLFGGLMFIFAWKKAREKKD